MTSQHDSRNPQSRLIELRAATRRRIASLERSFDAIVEATGDGAVDDEHDPEGHTIAWERQQIASMLTEARAKLDDIDAADQRLDAGLYGRCSSCGLSVEEERLVALPTTLACVACADPGR